MNTLLRDMLAHREWADATHIAALASQEGACRDAVVIHRLHHMLLVQRHFLGLTGGLDESQDPSDERFTSVTELAAHARATHEVERAYVATLGDAALDELIEIPFPQSPLRIARWQALAQSAMHSQHHRAQNATRLRELGGEPPITDLILWYWLQRPVASWGAPA